jgi:hypothetical protein
MDLRRSVAALAAATLTLTLAACGGNKTTTETTATTAPMSEGARERAALPMGSMAPVPSSLHCGAVKPVWVNTHTKVYHDYDDPYYGRTKHGEYMCPSAAAAAGYHPAGEHVKSKQ